MKNPNESTAQSQVLFNDLLNDLRSLVADAEKVMEGEATERSEDALSALRARFAAAQERFTELYANAKSKVVAGVKCTDGAIRENPYQALAIVLGVGLLAGVLIGRRGK